MNDVRFNQALNVVLALEQRGCLKHAAGLDNANPQPDQPLPKPCNRQIIALLIIYDWLLQLELEPEKLEDDLQQTKYLNDWRCPHCGNQDIN